MRVLIVEDETTAADNLSYLLRKIDPSIDIIGYTESVEQTVAILEGNPLLDIIFMDIHLSDGSAFTIFDRLEVDVPIVFTTAYDQYALDAFKVNSIDYLLKPIRLDELKRALSKYRQRSSEELLSYLSSMAVLKESKNFPSRIIVPVRDKFLLIAVSDICYVYSTNRQTEIVLNDSRKFSVNKTLEQMQSSLDPNKFRRANKQFIISKDAIKELTVWFDSRLVVKMSIETPENIFVSKNSASEFKRWLTE